MAQTGWVWVDNKGNKYRVGIYHGDQSGHVAIHCNLRIVQIDFSVQDSRTYTFFIDEELCEIRLEKHKNGRFSYDFQINKTANTPRNQIRKADERQIRRHLGWFVGGVIVFLAVVFWGLQQYAAQQRLKHRIGDGWSSQLNEKNVTRLSSEGRDTIVRLSSAGTGFPRRVAYRFTTADGRTFADTILMAGQDTLLLPNGFPLQNEDAFWVRYLPSDPRVHRLDFMHPVRATLEAYMARATVAEHTRHPEQTPEQSACVARMVMEMKGWPALAFVVNQGLSEDQHRRYNQNAYLRLMRSSEMQKIIQQQCWIAK